MGNRRAFRPSLDGLEGRELLSHAAARVAGRAERIAASQPVAGNALYDLPTWMAYHDAFVGEARAKRPPVVFLGDSMTFFWGEAWHELPGANVWAERFAPLPASAFGIPADRAVNLLWRVRHGELDGRPKVAVVLVGVNDLLTGESPDQTAAGVSAVVRTIRAQSPRTRVLLLGILPAHESPDDPLRAQVAATNERIAPLGRLPGVTYLDIGPQLAEPDGTLPKSILGDGLHPTELGYRRLADAIDGPIRHLLGPAAGRRP